MLKAGTKQSLHWPESSQSEGLLPSTDQCPYTPPSIYVCLASLALAKQISSLEPFSRHLS